MLKYLMLIKRRPSQVYAFVDNNYIHEHVMITKLYIVVHILYIYISTASLEMNLYIWDVVHTFMNKLI